MTDNEYRELAQRLRNRGTDAGWPKNELYWDAATAILTLLAERPPREPEGERPRGDAAPPAEPSPSQRMADAGYKRRPSHRALPDDTPAEPVAQQPPLNAVEPTVTTQWANVLRCQPGRAPYCGTPIECRANGDCLRNFAATPGTAEPVAPPNREKRNDA